MDVSHLSEELTDEKSLGWQEQTPAWQHRKSQGYSSGTKTPRNRRMGEDRAGGGQPAGPRELLDGLDCVEAFGRITGRLAPDVLEHLERVSDKDIHNKGNGKLRQQFQE